MTCAECDELLSVETKDIGSWVDWLETLPAWLRWIIALPGVAIVGAIVVRQLELYGLRDLPLALFYALAAALVIVAAAHVAAFAAPAYRKHIGLAIAFAEVAVFFGVLIAATIVVGNWPPRYPSQIVIMYAVIPLVAMAASVISLGRIKAITNGSLGVMTLPGSDQVLKWFLAISAALAIGAAFEIVSMGVSALWPSYLPIGPGTILSALIGTGIAVTLVAEYAPARKMVAAWAVAGFFIVLSVAAISYLLVLYLRYGSGYGLLLFEEAYDAQVFAATIVGASLGLTAALHNKEICAPRI